MAGPAFADVITFLQSQGQDYPFLYRGQKLMWGGGRAFGACCEPLLADNVNALRLDSYSRAAYAFTSAAAGPLVCGTAAASPSFFAAGRDESGLPQGFPATYVMRAVDTNAFPGGAPVNRGHLFWIFGVATEIESVVDLTSDPTSSVIPAWLYTSPAGVGAGSYYERIYREIAESISLQFKFLNTSVTYDMGGIADYPSMSGLSGKELLSVGSHLVGAYIPLQSVLAVNARDESRKLTVTSTPNRTMSVSNDPNNPSLAGTFHATVKMRLYGIDICEPQAAALCGAPNGLMDISVLINAINQNPAIFAALSGQQPQTAQANPQLGAALAALLTQKPQ